VAGKLTLKGQSRDIIVPVVLSQSDGKTHAIGNFTVKRLEFRLGDQDWKDTSLVANEVDIKFKLLLSGLAPF
jgi:polyisoprenoid-binding protein YceI